MVLDFSDQMRTGNGKTKLRIPKVSSFVTTPLRMRLCLERDLTISPDYSLKMCGTPIQILTQCPMFLDFSDQMRTTRTGLYKFV